MLYILVIKGETNLLVLIIGIHRVRAFVKANRGQHKLLQIYQIKLIQFDF